MFLKRRDQRGKDRQRQCYVITFPARVDANQVKLWLNTISGGMRGITDHIQGQPSLVFEVWADSRGITHRLKVPWQRADHIIPQLRSKVPGVHVVIEEHPPRPFWTKVEELRETSPSRSLHIPSVEALAESLLNCMQPLSEGEAMLLQWVLTPVKREKLPTEQSTSVGLRGKADKDELSDRRGKLAEPNFKGVVRIAARAETEPAAGNLIYRLRAVLDSTRSPYNRFAKIMTFGFDKLEERLRLGRSSVAISPPVAVSISEMTGLLGWKLGEPNVAGLPGGMARQLPATETIPREGRILAYSNYDGVGHRPLALSPKNALMHSYVIGPTGTGKSVALASQALQDINAGHGVIIIDPKDDVHRDNLFNLVLDRIPPNRVDDVIIIDVRDTEYPPGLNVLQGNPHTVADTIQKLIDHIFPTGAGGMMLQRAVEHSILTLMTSKHATQPLTLADMRALCTPRADQVQFADWITRGVEHNEELMAFWQDIDNKDIINRRKAFEPLMNRIWVFSNRPAILNIVGQSGSTINFQEVLSGQKILLVQLAGEGDPVLKLMGALLMNGIWAGVRAGASSPAHPVYMYLDEVQKVMHLPVSVDEMLAEARSQGLGLTMAHQYLGQHSENKRLLEGIMANARTKMAFQTNSDALALSRMFGRAITEDDLTGLQKFDVMAQFMTDAGVSRPVTGSTKPLGKPTGMRERAIALSRQKYSRRRAEVELEMKARRTVPPGVYEPPPEQPKPRTRNDDGKWSWR